MMETRFYDETNCFYVPYDENDCSAAEAIEQLLDNDVRVIDLSVDSDTLFDSCGFTTGYISVAWYERVGYLGHMVFQWGLM